MKSKKLKELTDWDWETLVASWRYYENRMTIASASFPGEIVRRFFTGDYTEDACRRIARQFVEVDHYDGEKDWIESKFLYDCDKKPWCMLYAFLKAYLNGFSVIKASNGKMTETVEAFFCEYTGKWHPKKEYVEGGICSTSWIPEEFIKEINGVKAK